MYKRYFEILKKVDDHDNHREVSLSQHNIDALLDLKREYADMLAENGDIAALEVLDSFTFDDLLSLCHAGFSEPALDHSVKEVVTKVDEQMD